jgi:hypothetical protein
VFDISSATMRDAVADMGAGAAPYSLSRHTVLVLASRQRLILIEDI